MLQHKTVYTVPCVLGRDIDHERNFTYLIQEALILRAKTLRARTYKEGYKSEALAKKAEAQSYKDRFNVEANKYEAFFTHDLFDEFTASILQSIQVTERMTQNENNRSLHV
jgi:hypothetical protein